MGRDIRGIKRQDVAARVREIALTRPIQANRALAIMGGMFSWAMDVAVLIETNPAARLKRVTQEHSRDRVLSDAEIGAVWFASGEVHRGFTGWIDGRWWNAEGYPWQQFFRLLPARLAVRRQLTTNRAAHQAAWHQEKNLAAGICCERSELCSGTALRLARQQSGPRPRRCCGALRRAHWCPAATDAQSRSRQNILTRQRLKLRGDVMECVAEVGSD
jgi:hypothetical protein